MNSTLISPNLMSSLALFFPSTADIQTATQTQDATGEPVDSWSNVHTAVPCAIKPLTDVEWRRQRGTAQIPEISTHHMILQGVYTDITPRMQAVSGSKTFDITGAETDSHQVMTFLLLREVVP